MKKRLAITLTMVLVLALALIANGFAARNLKEIIIGMAQEPDTLNNMLSDMSATSQAVGGLTDDLLERDANWKLFPQMATKIPTIENGLWKVLPGEKMQVTWQLKKGLRWRDGKEITAEDFKFTWEVIMNDDLGVPSREVSELIEKFEIKDKYTFVLHFKQLYHLANLGLDYNPIPKHIFEPIVKSGAKAFAEADFTKVAFENGPYMVKEWVRGSHLVTVANPKYAGSEKAKVPTVIFRFISNTNTLMANLLAGAVDMLNPVGLTLDQGLALDKMIRDQKRATDYTVQFTTALTWEHIDFNLDNPWLKDKRVRQALVHGIDRQAMVDALFEGKQFVSHSYLPPKHYGYNPNVKQYEYNPTKAVELLAAAGWKKGSDGIMENAKGEKMILTIHTTAGNAVREKVEMIIKDQWKKIGVELKIENVPSTVLFGDISPMRNFEHMTMYAWTSPPTTNPYGLWDSSQIPTAENSYAGQNRPGWRNAKSDELCRAILKELDEKKRIALFHEHQVLWAEELPAIPLYFRVDVSATHKSLKNVMPTGNTTPITWNVQNWSWAN